VRNGHRTILPFALLAVSLAASCTTTDLTAPPDVVFALFDPAGEPPQIPLPNDLAMLGGQPNSLAVASFSQALDPASVRADDVIAIDLAAAAPIIGIAPSFDPATNRLLVMAPAAGWPAGRVAIVLRGGESGLRGASGEPVVATPAFYFARSTKPISNCTAPAPDCTSATSVLAVEQAVGLERLRQAFAPLLAAVEARGIARRDVVLAWTFTVAPSP